jgi:hypothetical protein
LWHINIDTWKGSYLLLVSEDQVDPLMQVLGDIIGLEGLAVLAHELACAVVIK